MESHGAQKRQAGFTLLELLVTLMVLAILSSVAIPVVKNAQQREKEIELYQTLRYMREAIDNYKRAADAGLIIPPPTDNFGYPESLQILVDGAPRRNSTGRVLFLRRIPIDPITGRAEWLPRSLNDNADTNSWGGGSVFDVHSMAKGTGLNGTPYRYW
jgi:general secretion pathway protein G